MRIYLRQILWVFSVLMALTHTSMAFADEAGRFKKAQTAAHTWLLGVDQGDYPKSWLEAAQPFKKAVTSAQWQTALTEARAPLGAVISRQPVLVQYKPPVPNAPTDEYVMIQYQTRFANRVTAIETVAPIRETDGLWRVSGYFVQPSE